MPITIPTSVTQENNRLSSDNISLLLLEITYPTETPVYICLNNTTITWNGHTWLPVSFSLTGLQETKDAEIPSVSLIFVDIDRIITPFLEEYAGAVGATVIMRVINSKYYLSNLIPEIEETFEILSCSVDSKNRITFKLGGENLLNRRCPKNRYLRNHCRFVFKSDLCGYEGLATNCSLDFNACTALGNISRFGGFPAVGNRGILS